MEELIQNFGPTVAVLLLVIYMLIKDRRNGKNSTVNPSMGTTKEQMALMQVEIHDLYEWHDTDDPETGMKRWLLMPQMLVELKGIRQDLGLLTVEIRDGHKRLRESIVTQTEAVVKNTATTEMLEGKIARFIK